MTHQRQCCELPRVLLTLAAVLAITPMVSTQTACAGYEYTLSHVISSYTCPGGEFGYDGIGGGWNSTTAWCYARSWAQVNNYFWGVVEGEPASSECITVNNVWEWQGGGTPKGGTAYFGTHRTGYARYSITAETSNIAPGGYLSLSYEATTRTTSYVTSGSTDDLLGFFVGEVGYGAWGPPTIYYPDGYEISCSFYYEPNDVHGEMSWDVSVDSEPYEIAPGTAEVLMSVGAHCGSSCWYGAGKFGELSYLYLNAEAYAEGSSEMVDPYFSW